MHREAQQNHPELVDLQLPLGIWLYSKQTQENAGKREMGFFKVLKELATNPVLYVSVPGLIVMHYGWFKLQQNKDLVPSEQQFTEQPILIISRYIYMGLKTGTWDMEAARAAGRPKSSEGKCEK
ncbi:uncharacterized protein LOC111251888 isoform X2 [Varroa destructor]|uniref:Uncharacterized protein n=1 Tax=Varroa destructor TaxID=109461 RepID=A0A7M7KF09_VARDE|nr:uncharacterized protein LOC111251888 isoform X2 [Varroa destructor]